MERSMRGRASFEVSSFCNMQSPIALFLSIIETECGQIVMKEMDETIDDDIAWP